MMTTAKPEQTRLVAYVPTDLHGWVKRQASAENRTVSNFIETLLRRMKAQEANH